MIHNIEHIINKSSFHRSEELMEILEEKFAGRMLRWFISEVTEKEVIVEITVSEGVEYFSTAGIDEEVGSNPGKSVVISVIPTGIGCEIGGYAADAAPAAALLAATTDYLVTNPNAVNASNFIFMKDNVLYTEGFMIDRFCQGMINLYQPYTNKVGVVLEKTSPKNLEVVFNIINTVRAVYGVDIEQVVITHQPIGACCVRNKSGSYVGKLEEPGPLFEACDHLIKKGINAIAVASDIRNLPTKEYAWHFQGKHPNPVGGAEAIISHLIGARYQIPTAHAPLINMKKLDLENQVVDARGAGEYSSACGLACVLVGLSKAPQPSIRRDCRVKDQVNINNVVAVVAPHTALGGIPMLCAQKHGIPIIAVKDNKTILNITPHHLNLNNVIEVNNYAEAAGIILALEKGISIQSISRPLPTLRAE